LKSWTVILILAGAIAGGVYLSEKSQARRAAHLPHTGEVQRFYRPTGAPLAPFRITTKASQVHYYVKLEDWNTAAPVTTVFIRKGEEASIVSVQPDHIAERR
jgi:hypothetical protein